MQRLMLVHTIHASTVVPRFPGPFGVIHRTSTVSFCLGCKAFYIDIDLGKDNRQMLSVRVGWDIVCAYKRSLRHLRGIYRRRRSDLVADPVLALLWLNTFSCVLLIGLLDRNDWRKRLADQAQYRRKRADLSLRLSAISRDCFGVSRALSA